MREKVLAEAAKTWIIVADYRKNSPVLGTNVRHPILASFVDEISDMVKGRR